jgi:hypothetical protein
VRFAPLTSVAVVLSTLTACSNGAPRNDEMAEARCADHALFAGLAQVTRRAALCPSWLPKDSKVLTSHASDDPPAYMVEFGPIHIVLSFGVDDLPGDETQPVKVRGRSATVLFNASGRGAPGLHSGHFVLELPAPVDSRGAYSVSLHAVGWQSQRRNISTLLRVANSLTPTPAG